MIVNLWRLATNYRRQLADELRARESWPCVSGRLAAGLAWEWAVSIEILYPSALRAELRAASSDQLLETRP